MLQTPLGEIIVSIDNKPVQYEFTAEPLNKSCPDLNGRYSITVKFEPDGRQHTVSCRIIDHVPDERDDIETGERLELKSFYKGNTKLSIGMENDDLGLESEYDYDTSYLDDGVQYEIRTFTRTLKYVFGIAWILNFTDENENQTWFGADPFAFEGKRHEFVQNMFVLRWNPAISSYKKETHKSLCRDIKKNDSLFMNWSIYEWEKLCYGDAFITQQVGGKNDGIAVIGKFVSRCFEEESWRDDGTKIHYADIKIFYAFDREKEKVLGAEELERDFPNIDWHGGHSGMMMKTEDAERLINKIDSVLKEIGAKNGKTFREFLGAF